eukprot:TRINITY_DN27985_c0_g1_i1.p1 TRINITY_DN27985_c0_g1~~TRINITY_DN27985_c0_g1_i1.p1  ORF type:complete len:202 (+),score=6.98 TRINITY_DN27985_c0_g1_i1:36-641(+)
MLLLAFLGLILGGTTAHLASVDDGSSTGPIPASKCPPLPTNCPHKPPANVSKLFHQVCMEAGTEPPENRCEGHFGGGFFRCACCGAELFPASSKCNPHTGWPAFSNAVPRSFCYPDPHKTHIRCAKCGAHLGDYFTDSKAECHLSNGKASHFCIDGVCLDPPPNKIGWKDSCTGRPLHMNSAISTAPLLALLVVVLAVFTF